MSKGLENLRNVLREHGSTVSRIDQLGLEHNPFPMSGVVRSENLPPVDEEAADKVFSFISTTFANDVPGCLTIFGDYGSGKTHLIKYCIREISKLASEMSNPPVALYVNNPGAAPKDLGHRIVQQIGEENMRKYLWSIIARDVEELEDYLHERKTLFAAELGPDIIANYQEFRKCMTQSGRNFSSLKELFAKKLKDFVGDHDPGLTYRLSEFLFDESKTSNWDAIAGMSGSKEFEKKERIFLSTLVKILKDQGFSHVYVFVDEFEDVTSDLSKKARLYYMTTLRILTDVANWSLVVAMNSTARQVIAEEKPPLLDRIAQWNVYLMPLAKPEAVRLISNYLKLAGFKGTVEDFFADELIDRILAVSKGNTRAFLTTLHKAVQYAVQRGWQSPLDETLLDNMIESGWIYIRGEADGN